MFRLFLACCVGLFAADATGATLSFGCMFTPQNSSTYTQAQANQLSNAVTCIETAKSTATARIWRGAGPNNCIYTVTCTEVASGLYNWGVSISDERGLCVVQSGTVNTSSTAAGGSVRSSTAWTRAWFGASDGSFTVGP